MLLFHAVAVEPVGVLVLGPGGVLPTAVEIAP